MGDLDQPDSYSHALEEVEVAVHCAFDFSSDKGVERDAKTIESLSVSFQKVLSRVHLSYTSGVWVYGSMGYKMVDESLPVNPINIVKWRPGHEEKVLKATSSNLRTVVIRPGHVYGGVGGLTNILFTSTLNGSVMLVGEGHNRWPMVHLQDLAHAYVSAAEKELSGLILNVVDDSTATLREMTEAIASAAHLEGKINVLPIEEAKKQFGPLADGFLIDLTVNNSRVKRLLGWQIHHAPFVYEANLYYNAWQTAQEAEEF